MKKLNFNIITYILALVLFSLIPLMDLFHPGLFVGHDSPDHVARIANFYKNLQDGNIIPRWAPNLNWGYGHPILMFLYPLPSYVASLFHFLGFSLSSSTEIVFGLGFVLSGIAMYWWIKELWGEKAGFISGLFYIFAPYRFVDLYVRGAIGENFFFIWPPLVLYFLTKLSKKLKWSYVVGGSLSFAAMLLSHNALSLMYFPFIVIYGFLLIWSSNRKLPVTCYLLPVAIFGFALSAFFWMPAFFEGKYTLRDIVSGNEIFNRFETFKKLLYSPWNYGITGQFSVQLGLLQWGVIILAPLIIYWFCIKSYADRHTNLSKLPIINCQLLIASFLFFCLSIILIHPISKPVYQTLTILQKFQFPWRWLSLAIFPPAIFAGALIYLISKKYKLFLIFTFSFLILFLNRNYWHAKALSNKPESYYSGIYHGTTDTGESAPIWSVRFMEKEPKTHMETIQGNAQIKEILHKSTEHKYIVNVKSEKARLLENTLYFPGWRVYIDKQQADLQFQDPAYRGLMTFWIDNGEHEIIVKFGETKLRVAADIISLTSIAGIIGITLALYSTKVLKKG